MFDGTDLIDLTAKEMRAYWGAEMAMIFQDPMTSLNPVMKIGKQITESMRQHLDVDQAVRERAGREPAPVGAASPSPSSGLKEYPHQLSGGMRQRV